MCIQYQRNNVFFFSFWLPVGVSVGLLVHYDYLFFFIFNANERAILARTFLHLQGKKRKLNFKLKYYMKS